MDGAGRSLSSQSPMFGSQDAEKPWASGTWAAGAGDSWGQTPGLSVFPRLWEIGSLSVTSAHRDMVSY